MMPNQFSSSASHSRSHASVTCSSSVAAGDDFHSMAFTFKVAATKSASIDGGEEETEKYAKNRGWFQRVNAGKMVDRKSAKIFSIGSPACGACFGSAAINSPGR